MRLVLTAVVLWGGLALSITSNAQEGPGPDELKKMYEDAIVQLKAAQDRKNELGMENEKLKERVAELESQLAHSHGQLQTTQAELAGYADRTFHLRAWHAAWQDFLKLYPDLLGRWKVYLETDVLHEPRRVTDFLDPDWPLTAEG